MSILLTIGFTIFISDSKAEDSATKNTETNSCEFSSADTMWINQAISAWHYTNKTITNIPNIAKFDVLFFDADCQRMSSDALIKPGSITWTSALHENTVQFPNGDEMPPIVNSFTMSSNDEGGKTFFVMAVPSIWRDGGIKSTLGLETFLVPVMLHEAMHAIQSPTYGKQIEFLSRKHNLPDSFNDDSVQKMFQDNSDFSASVTMEVDLLMQSALAPTDDEARKLAQKAREMIKARYKKWFVGDFEKYRQIGDVWLTMEGSGQWLGYRWLSSADGGNLSKAEAIKSFGQRGKWWSQKLGFALFMAVDRLSDNWKNDAFGSGSKTVFTLLDDALLKT